MENTLQQQLDISKGLLEALDRMVYAYESMTGNMSNQTSSTQNLVKEMQRSENLMEATTTEAQNLAREMESTATEKYIKSVEKSGKNATDAINNSLEEATRLANQAQNNAKKSGILLTVTKGLFNLTKNISLGAGKLVIFTLKGAVKLMAKIPGVAAATRLGIKLLNAAIDKFVAVKDSVMSGGIGLLYHIPRLMWNMLKTLFSIMTSLIGAATKFFMFTMSLPFTIAKIASKIGNTIRRDLVEVIQAAGEEAKESFDLTSHIGRSADKMTGMAKGLLKAFNSPRTRLSRLFGMGAAGAATFLKETFKAVADMGHYSEFYGQSLMGSTESAQYLIEMQRAMGLGAKELAYYAMEAFNSGKHPIDTLHETSELLDKTAKENGLDFKALTKEFHVLRTNIVDFGNLSSNEIANLTAKLRKMGVKTEDAVNVFKKFTSLEEATKASAMLFQSFEMNVDAFDLLTARNPGEMLQQFRDAMFQTGRSFKDLNRHEKALMSNITGVSEQGLASLMNYMSLGMTYEEAKSKMEAQDPTQQQTKMIKGLTSTIKMFQKTMMFNSPFDAFFRGLTNNVANQKELRNMVVGLSRIYEDIYHVGFSLDVSQLKSMLGPITVVLTKLNGILTGNTFKETMKHVTKAAGDFASEFANDIQNTTAKQFFDLDLKVRLATKNLMDGNNKLSEKAQNAIVKTYQRTIKQYQKRNPKNKDLMKKLKEEGLIASYSKNSVRFAKDLSYKVILDRLQSLSRKEGGEGGAYNSVLNALYQKLDSAYETTLGKASDVGVKEVIKQTKIEFEKRKTVKGRISNLYDNLTEAVRQGGPLFTTIKNIGGGIMGSIIKGIGYGIAAAFRFLKDGVAVTVNELNITGADGKPVKAIDYLGLKEDELKDAFQEMGKESTKLVLKFPTFMSVAGSFIADLTAVVSRFGASLLGYLGEYSYKFYMNADLDEQAIMFAAGFRPGKALSSSLKKDVLVNKSVKSKLESISQVIEKYNNNLNEDEKMVDSTKRHTENLLLRSVYEQLAKSANKNSFTYKFLNHPSVKGAIYDRYNITFHTDPKRQATYKAYMSEVIHRALQIDQAVPSKVFDLYKNYPVVIDHLKKNYTDKMNNLDEGSLKAIKHIFSQTESKGAISGSDLNLIAGGISYNNKAKNEKIFNDNMSMISQYEDSTNKNTTGFVKYLNQEFKLKVKSNTKKNKKKVQDVQVEGAGIKLEMGDLELHLDDHDAFYAAKKGGFLNDLHVEIFNVYNKFTEGLFNSFNQRLTESNANIVNAKAEISSLKTTIIKREEFEEEASEEDILNLFNMCLDLFDLESNREVKTKTIVPKIATS